jgi:superfamily II DNA or RNA helicase
MSPLAPPLASPVTEAAAGERLASLSPDQRQVLDAFATGAVHRARTWIYTLLGDVQARDERGRRFTAERVRDLIHELRAGALLDEHPQRQGFFRLPPVLDNLVLMALLDGGRAPAWCAALRRVEQVDRGPHGTLFHVAEAAIAVLRFELFAGLPLGDLEARWRRACSWSVDWGQVLTHAAFTAQTASLLRRLDPQLQTRVLEARLARVAAGWLPDLLPLAAPAHERLAAEPDNLQLRMNLIEYLWCCGQDGPLPALAQPLREAGGEDGAYRRALADVVDGLAHAARAEWAQAEALYDAALPTLRRETGQRKALLPPSMMLPYLQSLLAGGGPARLDKALKLCLAEAGQRKPTPDSGWGVAALAIQVRLGTSSETASLFEPLSSSLQAEPTDLWKWLMRAWLHNDAAAHALKIREREAAGLLRVALQRAGLQRLHGQLDDALALLAGSTPQPGFFVPPPQESWRTALVALAALAPSAPEQRAGPASRLVWVLSVDEHGAPIGLVPLEQKRGARGGWNRPQPVSLAKLARLSAPEPHDAKVLRHIKPTPYGGARDMTVDLAAALAALVGHPALEFDERPGVPVELVEGTPDIEVVDAGDTLRVSVRPPLREPASTGWASNALQQKAAQALADVTVLRDGPQRARLVRYSPEQRRAALLLRGGLAVPKAAAAELQPVLQALGGHFHVQADSASPDARDVPGASELRAELTPLGDGVRLRLVAAPFGADGPRLVPGHGRPRMIAPVGGETLAVQRDLAAERAHLAAVLDACPPLAGAAVDEATFDIAEADDALALLEALPRLPAVQALDWPAGRAVSVAPVGSAQLQVRVQSQRDWLALSGQVQVDEQLAYGLEQLLQWSAGARSRFVPLGDGRYLALTQELRTRVAELAAVAELHKGEARVPALAAGWLDAALDGVDWRADARLGERIERLVHARSLQPALPPTLQAELRPYQVEGYQWAMRLADAGCGACLADDMGLGKTLQSLAVLLARAAGGAALVAAPTSLMGNWQAEARRFAPSLRVRVYGDDGDRAATLADAGAGELVLVSYPLLQIDAEAFAQRDWHTLVLDEAQALKNAAAKRTQAAQALRADFRLALSGTPVENRLAELWSIMRICNPGLLGTLARFNERFAGPIERDRNRDAQRTLRRLIAPFILRRTKAQVLDDLPPRTELVLTVQPEPAERAHYEALRRQAVDAAERSLEEGGGQAQFNILAQLTRLRRAACDPRLVSPLGLVGAKVQAFGELAAELAANGHKALVFSQFVDFLALLREPLDAAGIAYQYLDGSTPAAERTRRVAAFQGGEGTLFLISLKAGGFGLNLTVADYVVIADPWWNPAAEDQASGRAHRIGQQRPVTVYRLVNAGTLEERIVELHQHKRELADGVLEGSETGELLDAQALVGLIRG